MRKKINRIFTIIPVYILAITLTGVSSTYLSEYLTSIDWFGDDPSGRWGARHYYYGWCVFLLTITTLAKVIVSLVCIIEGKND